MSYSDKEFLEKIKPLVIADMKQSGILASLTAAQAFIESNKGNSGLTEKCNNLFGIKGEYQGQSGLFWTTEYYNGIATRVQAKFRKYPSWAESIADHSALFNRMSRYANLRGLKDYKLACKYVKEDGYATSPTYTQTLINCIEKYKLYEWDYLEQPGEYSNKPKIESDTPTLKIGSSGDYVKHVQLYLSLLGYQIGKVDSIYGVQTAGCVKEYQMDKGLKVDGIWGKECWKSVGK